MGSLPAGFRLGDNDSRILAVAKNLSDEGYDVAAVSKDLPLRVKASAVGLPAEEYRAELAVESGWTGMAELDVTVAELDALYDEGRVEHLQAAGAALPHRADPALPAAAAWAGSGRTSRSGWSAATGTPSGCTAARPSSGSPRPAPRPGCRHRLARRAGRHWQSPPWRCAPGWRR